MACSVCLNSAGSIFICFCFVHLCCFSDDDDDHGAAIQAVFSGVDAVGGGAVRMMIRSDLSVILPCAVFCAGEGPPYPSFASSARAR